MNYVSLDICKTIHAFWLSLIILVISQPHTWVYMPSIDAFFFMIVQNFDNAMNPTKGKERGCEATTKRRV